jgi:hypothetical protein
MKTYQPGELVPPSIESYRVWEQDPFTGESRWTGEYDYGGYNNALAGYREMSKTQTNDLAEYLDATIASIGLDIEAGRLDLAKASGEFGRRFDAFKEAGDQYANMFGYAIPSGLKYLPGSSLDLTGKTVPFDPFGEAMNLVNSTPDLTGVQTPQSGVASPDNVFNRALQLSNSFQGAGGGGAPAAPATGAGTATATMSEEEKRKRDLMLAAQMMGGGSPGGYGF